MAINRLPRYGVREHRAESFVELIPRNDNVGFDVGMSTFRGTLLHATCYMLHATCYMLYVTCYMLHATCYMFRDVGRGTCDERCHVNEGRWIRDVL
ncbi:MAG: hypothetical protein BWY14_00029 [Parcubacteria group bacterium ADurb.Bin192]|nr:MAG: hypothetical protein BWY14_00029 [Parcubacteria group bacterium ADurb.Bin192]